MPIRSIKALFVIVGVSELVCGGAFSIAPGQILRAVHAVAPNPLAYIQFPALLVFVYGTMFLRIATDPAARREQILYGIALKIVFCSLVFWYWFKGDLPTLWLPFASIDVVILFLFILSWRSLGGIGAESSSGDVLPNAATLAEPLSD